MKKASYLRTASVLLFSVALLFGCSSGGGSGSGSGTPAASNGGATTGAPQKDQMVIAVNENFITMDPQNTGDALSSGVQSAMFEGLLIYDKDLKLMSGLSTEYSVN